MYKPVANSALSLIYSLFCFFVLRIVEDVVREVSCYFFIFSRMGMIWSKVGLLPGSSFMQILMSLAM